MRDNGANLGAIHNAATEPRAKATGPTVRPDPSSPQRKTARCATEEGTRVGVTHRTDRAQEAHRNGPPRRRMRVPAHTSRPRPRLNNSRKVTRRQRILRPLGGSKPIHRLRRTRPAQCRASSTGYPPPCRAISRAVRPAAPNPAESRFEEAKEVSCSPLRLPAVHLGDQR